MGLEQTERSLLARVAFFLCRNGQVPDAEAVFAGLAASEPDRDGPVAGLALCDIIKGKCDEATARLDKCLERGDSPLAGSLSLYKLVALGMAGRLPEARAFREKMSADGMGKEIDTADRLLADLEAVKK